jgi:hypothetical protein
MSERTVTPSDDLAALARSQPVGTRFLLSPGVYRQGPIQPRDDQQFIGQPGVIFDGEGTREYCFGGVKGGTGGKRVVLRGFEVTRYNPAAQSAAIRPFGQAYDWVVEDLFVHDSANWGIQVDSGWKVRRCVIERMGTMGLGGGGNAQTVIEDCEVTFCNTVGADSHWEAGGMKFVYSDHLTVRNNWVHENGGPGIWFDGHSTDAQIISNDVEDNAGPGVDYEINRGALIENNHCEGNGTDPTWADDYDLAGGGIYVLDCDDVVIRNNDVWDNAGGIGLVDDARSGRDQWPPLDNIEVYGNRIRYAQRKTGIAIASGRPALASSVRFHDNQYEIEPAAPRFRLGSATMNWPVWQEHWIGETLYTEESQQEDGMAEFGVKASLQVTGVKSEPVKPGKPTGLFAERSLAWTVVPGATSYRIQRRTASGVWVGVKETDKTALFVPERGRYRVRAINQAGAGPWAYLLV